MANRFKTLWLFVLMSGLFMGFGAMMGGRNGLLLAFAAAMAINFFMYWFSAGMVLRQYNAREVTQAEAPKLYYIVEELAAHAQIPMPKVYIIDSPALNAFATGRNPSHAVVCVTTGIMSVLNEMELKGVLGHELSHVKNYDMLTGTIAAGFAMAVSMLAYVARWGAYGGGYGSDGRRRGGNPLLMLLGALVAPLVFTLVKLAITRSREYGADEDGAKLSGSTEGLASALQKIRDTQMQGLVLPGNQATAHLMIAPTQLGSSFAELFATHPDINKRIERLRHLNIYGR